MKSTAKHHGIMSNFIIFLVLCPQIINLVGAQMVAPPPENNSLINNSARFTPAMGVILIILIGGFLFMSFYSIYIRNCYNSSNNNNNVPRVGSLRTRRGATHGLEASVIETFPTFTYSEVKDHKIGKGALECAVCLNEFEDEETLRLLPKCDHVFHPECIDAWLGSHVTCPVCRADLVPKPDDKPVSIAVSTDNNDDGIVERSGSRNGEVIVQVDREEPSQESRVKRNLSFDYANRLRKSLSIKKFRSHSTGHSLVQPGENLERYTLRLPAQVRKEVIHRATLNRAKSCAVVLPREGSLRSGYRRDRSTRNGRFDQNIEQWSDRRAKSLQWNFLARGFSKRSPKMGIENDQESTSKGNEIRTPKKMPSFNCLEPKAVDEVSLFSNDQLVKSSM